MKFKLGELIEFVNERVKLSKLNENNYISTENMVPNKGGITKAYNLPSVESVIAFRREDTLFSNIRTYFEKIFYADFNGGASPDVLVMRSKNNLILEPMYLYYLVTNKKFIDYTVLTSKGAKMPRGDKTAILNFELNLPSLSEQRKTSKILGDLDNKITLNRQINQTLEAMAQALFKSWFVDFEPVKAKMSALAVGGSANDANLAAMSAISGKTTEQLLTLKTTHPDQFQQLYTTADLFPSEMVDSELGEIPKGWEVGTVGDIVERLKSKKSYTKNEVLPFGNTPVFEQGAGLLLGFHNEVAGLKATPEEPLFIFGDHTCVMKISFSDFDISSNVIPLRGKGFPTAWVYHSTVGKQEFQEYRRHWSEFVIQPVFLPTKDVTIRFSSVVTELHLQIESLSKQCLDLSLVRDALLPKLLSGELVVDGVSE